MKKKDSIVFKAAYAAWKKSLPALHTHPQEEILAIFADGGLSEKEWRRVSGHLLHCRRCSEAVVVAARCGGPWQLFLMIVYPLRRMIRERVSPIIVRALATRPPLYAGLRFLMRKKILQAEVS